MFARRDWERKRPCPIDELCSESSESSSTFDANDGQMVGSVRNTCSCVCLDQLVPELRLVGWFEVAAKRTEEKSTDPLVSDVEAWAVAVSSVTQ